MNHSPCHLQTRQTISPNHEYWHSASSVIQLHSTFALRGRSPGENKSPFSVIRATARATGMIRARKPDLLMTAGPEKPESERFNNSPEPPLHPPPPPQPTRSLELCAHTDTIRRVQIFEGERGADTGGGGGRSFYSSRFGVFLFWTDRKSTRHRGRRIWRRISTFPPV